MAHIALFQLDLADNAHGPQIARMVRPAHGDPDPPAAPGKLAHHIAAHKAGASENDRQFSRHVPCLLTRLGSALNAPANGDRAYPNSVPGTIAPHAAGRPGPPLLR